MTPGQIFVVGYIVLFILCYDFSFFLFIIVLVGFVFITKEMYSLLIFVNSRRLLMDELKSGLILS